jgi:hypothetical protein
MKKLIFGIAIVLGALFWAKSRYLDPPKEHVPTESEIMAEKVGRIARAKREGKPIDPGDLKVISQAIPLDGTTTNPQATATISQEQLQQIIAAAAAVTSTSAPEVGAKARVQRMMEYWKSGDPSAFSMAAVQWQSGLAIALDPKSFDQASSEFASFIGEKSLPKEINAYEVQSAYHRSEGSRSYTVIDVSINGSVYHMGVPEKAAPIFWTY